MKLVTVATKNERYFPYLELSSKRYGHDLVVLGWGKAWQGFTWKFMLMLEYLKTLKSDEIVCFIDAYDVIILEDPKTIEAKFKTAVGGQKDKIFVSSEGVNKSFINSIGNDMIFRKCKGEYINSGTYIGYSSAIIKMLDGLCNEFDCSPNRNDQVILQDYCAKHEEQFIVDINCDIFIVTGVNIISKVDEKTENITYDGNRLKYKSHYPSILHSPGNGRLDDIIIHLGYDPTIYTAPANDNIKYWLRNLYHFIIVLLKKYIIFIILFLLILMTFLARFSNIKFFKKIRYNLLR